MHYAGFMRTRFVKRSKEQITRQRDLVRTMPIHKPIESTIFDKIDGADGTSHRDLCSNRHHHSSAINDTLTAHMEQNKHTAVTLSLANSGFIMKRKMGKILSSDAKISNC
jgi:hypothetical protein